METFKEMIERREREAREFEERYANAPEELEAIVKKAIATIEAHGYIVRSYENRYLGKLNEECPIAYEIMRGDYSTLYGYGTCSAEQVVRFAEGLEDPDDTVEDADHEDDNATETPVEPEALQAMEKEYDDCYNEGEEGYNPYRTGSTPTYKPHEKRAEEEII